MNPSREVQAPVGCPIVDEWEEIERKSDIRASTLDVRLDTLHKDVGEVKIVLRDLTQAITKLALIEERQGHTTQAVERAFMALEKLETRIGSIEKRMPMHDKVTMWVERILIAGAAVVGTFIIKKAGLF